MGNRRNFMSRFEEITALLKSGCNLRILDDLSFLAISFDLKVRLERDFEEGEISAALVECIVVNSVPFRPILVGTCRIWLREERNTSKKNSGWFRLEWQRKA